MISKVNVMIKLKPFICFCEKQTVEGSKGYAREKCAVQIFRVNTLATLHLSMVYVSLSTVNNEV